jgi:hypothetical protein
MPGLAVCQPQALRLQPLRTTSDTTMRTISMRRLGKPEYAQAWSYLHPSGPHNAKRPHGEARPSGEVKLLGLLVESRCKKP